MTNSNINPSDITDIVNAGIENLPELIIGLGKLSAHPQLNLILLVMLAVAVSYALKRIDNIINKFVKPILEQKYDVKFPKPIGQKVTAWWQRVKKRLKRGKRLD